ncbi:hypothetical protein TrVGV298_003603 [Trichoderma virens]|nr:hypothetical protein TrVGV298_003603 [Trichoderma virens]
MGQPNQRPWTDLAPANIAVKLSPAQLLCVSGTAPEQRQFALSQRVSGPPCRAPAVATLLLKRKTEKPTIAALDGKMRTWRPPLAEIGTGRHAVAIYWPNRCHGERYCIGTVREHGTALDDTGRHWTMLDAALKKTQSPPRRPTKMPAATAACDGERQCDSASSRARTVAACSPTNAQQSLEPLANLDKHSTHTWIPPKNLPQPSLHAGPSPTWPSQTITFKGNHLA